MAHPVTNAFYNSSTNKIIIHESEQYWVKNIDYNAQQDHDARLPPLKAVYIVNERADRQTLHLLNGHPDKASASMFLQIVISSHRHLSQSKFFRTPCNTFFAIMIVIESTSSAPCSFFLFSLTWQKTQYCLHSYIKYW